MPALSERLTYKRAHLLVTRARGKAAGHRCQCGQAAKFWAYQHTDPQPLTDPHGRVYSSGVEHYSPMCAKCHRQFDIDNDARVQQAAQECGRQRGAGNRRRLQEDPGYAARMSASSQQAVKKVQAMRRRCGGCEMVSTPFGLASHQKRSGHQGYTSVA